MSHTHLPGHTFRAMKEQVPNRSGAGRGEVIWKTTSSECTSPGSLEKGLWLCAWNMLGYTGQNCYFKIPGSYCRQRLRQKLKAKALLRQTDCLQKRFAIGFTCKSLFFSSPLDWILWKISLPKVVQTLKQVPQGNGGITIPGNIQTLYICRAWGHGLVADLAVLG